MDSIYLVRHCQPETDGKKLVLGCRSDPPLSTAGLLHALSLRYSLPDISAVYCSDLLRSRETAGVISGGRVPVYVRRELRELDMGNWDGLSFDEIKRDYPELYAKRGEDNSLVPPGGEALPRASARLRSALEDIPCGSAVVSHAGVMRALLCELQNISFSDCFSLALPYGNICELSKNERAIALIFVSKKLNNCKKSSIIDRFLPLFCTQKTPKRAILHCAAVADTALEIAKALEKTHPLNEEKLYSAALLHDLCRAEENHAEKAAKLLETQGFPELAEIIKYHHDLPREHIEALDETAIVYFADKLLQGAEKVPVSKRFAASEKKCSTPAAQAAHKRRYEAAMEIAEKIKALTGQEF